MTNSYTAVTRDTAPNGPAPDDDSPRLAPEPAASAMIPTPRASNHAPSIAVLPDGCVVVAWFGGSDEGNGDIDILVSRRPAGAEVFDSPQAVTADPARADQNPGLFLDPQGRLRLLYTSQASRQSGITEEFNLQFTAVVREVTSEDAGLTWSAPSPAFDAEGTFARQPIQVLSDGRWVHPQWRCFDDSTRNGSDQPLLQISEDSGRSWQEVGFPEAAGRVHPNVVELDNELVTLFRSRFADWVYLSRSTDGGRSWSAPAPTSVPNNNSGISALRLPSGRLAVVSNDEQYNLDPETVLWPYERRRISITVSADRGHTWDVARVIEPGDGFTGVSNMRSNRRQEYPHAVVDSAGMIHVVYACNSRVGIRYVCFRENWIDGAPDSAHAECKLWT